MTTGSLTIGSIASPGPGSSRSWVGGDGRYTVDAFGFRTIKENPYSLSLATWEQVATSPHGYFISPGTATTTALDFGWVEAKNINKLAQKARTHSFHLGKNLGEFHQTGTMLSNNVKSIGRFLMSLKRGDVDGAWRALNTTLQKTGTSITSYPSKKKMRFTRISKVTERQVDLSDRFLEYEFGWKPLIQDSYAMANDIFDATKKPRKESVRVKSTGVLEYDSSNSPANWRCPGTCKYRDEIRYWWNEELSEARKLGLEDPAGVAWELMPWSFLIDWFIPIGTYLDSLNMIPLLKGNWVRTRAWESKSKALWTNYPPSHIYDEMASAVSTYGNVEVRRTVGTGFSLADIPLPSVKPLEKSLSLLHIAETIALVGQRVKGGKAYSGGFNSDF